MTSSRFPVEDVRAGLEDIPETVAYETTEPPPHEQIYIVPGHEKALNPETTLVIGDRGSGKSFWSAALNGDETRALIGRQLRRLDLEKVGVSWGFSVAEGSRDHPSRRVLRQLLKEKFEAEDIWRAVILYHLASRYRPSEVRADWPDRVRFVAESPEQEERILAEIDNELARAGQRHLVVFDALDRSGPDWVSIRDLVQGLLRVCLDLRAYRHIRTKLFMRPDMFEDESIWDFPDSSKLHHGRVMLEWRRDDLYGLLWHWIGNHARSGEPFRVWCERQLNQRFDPLRVGGSIVYRVPMPLRSDESKQAELLEHMASTYMGRGPRRGRTYTWLPNHLADAKGQVSPRSFLLAVKGAEAISRGRAGHQVLYWEGIKQGVRHASRIRVRELQEDYPWIQTILEPLKGMIVPCSEKDIKTRWRQAHVIDTIKKAQSAALSSSDDRRYLPPHTIDDQKSGDEEGGLIATLVEIGIISRLADRRLNIPDLFRVAAGIGRKGGVRPIR